MAAKGVISARGERVDFDLLKIKEQIASAPKATVVRAREDFIDQKFKRRSKKQVSAIPEPSEFDVAEVEDPLPITAPISIPVEQQPIFVPPVQEYTAETVVVDVIPDTVESLDDIKPPTIVDYKSILVPDVVVDVASEVKEEPVVVSKQKTRSIK